jgi:hypothetical protein
MKDFDSEESNKTQVFMEEFPLSCIEISYFCAPNFAV